MHYHILTLFPEMVEQGLDTSILGRAKANGYITTEAINKDTTTKAEPI